VESSGRRGSATAALAPDARGMQSAVIAGCPVEPLAGSNRAYVPPARVANRNRSGLAELFRSLGCQRLYYCDICQQVRRQIMPLP